MNKRTQKIILGVAILGLGIFGGLQVLAAISLSDPTVTPQTFRNYTFFASTTAPTYTATTTSATSTNIVSFVNSSVDGGLDTGMFIVKGAKKITVYFQRGDTTGQGNTGTSTFRIQVTPDGTNWFDYNKLVQNIGTSTIRMSTSTVNLSGSANINLATSTQIYSMDNLLDTFFAIRCIVVEATDGEHTCKASAEW